MGDETECPVKRGRLAVVGKMAFFYFDKDSKDLSPVFGKAYWGIFYRSQLL